MKPLSGVRIAVTRPEPQAEELAAPLRELGAHVVSAPLIRIVPTWDTPRARSAVQRAADFDWIVFSSANGVDLFVEAARKYGTWSGLHASVACVGPATAEVARRHGLQPAVVPEEHSGAGLAGALIERGLVDGRRILLARAAGGGEALPRLLEAAGASVTDIELYYSAPDPEVARLLKERLNADSLDLVTFTSGSAVRYFVESTGHPSRALVAVIGPVTAKTARDLGLGVAIEAKPHTTDGLVAAIRRHFEEKE